MSADKALIHTKLYQWFTRYNLHHIVLWVLYFIFWAYFYKPGVKPAEIYLNSLVFVAVHAAVSYFNIYFLFPNFLRKKNYGFYFIAIILSISLATLIQSVILMLFNPLSTAEKIDLFSIGFMLPSGMAITYTTAITMSLKLVKHWYENERLAQDLARLNTETELKYLKSQINPHFLFNSLNSIYALSLKKSDLAPELILKLSDILRYILYEGSEKKVSLAQEVKYLQSFLELEKVRHGDRMALDIKIEGELEENEIAPMLLIPFVENSFKHGLGKDKAGGFVRVRLEAHDRQLNFSIANSKPKNGHRLSNEKGYTGGIGLKNVKKRLNLLYPNKHKLTVSDTENEFDVSLQLELI